MNADSHGAGFAHNALQDEDRNHETHEKNTAD